MDMAAKKKKKHSKASTIPELSPQYYTDDLHSQVNSIIIGLYIKKE